MPSKRRPSAKPDVPLRAVAYCRVSTDRQAERGSSLDAQRAKLTAYCAAVDLELVATESDEGESAKSLDRPALQRALAMLRDARADALVVTKLDRLTRRVVDMGDLVETYFAEGKRCTLISLGDAIDTRTAGGRLVLNVLTSVAQWEREAIGERTRAVTLYRQARGEYIGGHPPYGFRLTAERKLEEDDHEQQTILMAVERRTEGFVLRKIAQLLASADRRSRAGKVFIANQIARMLREPPTADDR